MKIQRLTGSAAILAVLATTLGALGAAPAHASGPDEPAVKLSSSMVVDGPAEGGFGVTYTLTMSEPRRTEGKSFFAMTCSPGLSTGTVVSKPANWSAFDCSSSGGFLYQVNDLYEIRPGESESVVMHFVVSDVSAPASITVTSEYRDTPGTTASTDVAPMTVRSTALPNGRIGTPYAFRVETSRFTPSTFTATGLDAAGLSLDPASGTIFGTPTTRGSYP